MYTLLFMPADFIIIAGMITSAVMLPARCANGKYSKSANRGTAHVQPEAGKLTKKYLLPACRKNKHCVFITLEDTPTFTSHDDQPSLY